MMRPRMTCQGLGRGSIAHCVDWASASFDAQRGRGINGSGWCR